MLSKLKFNLKPLAMCVRRQCSNSSSHLNRVAENENHRGTENENFKYKTQASENFLSSNQIAERLTSFVEKIEILSPPTTTEIVKNPTETMSEVSRDRLGQWPLESESEMAGQGLQRLKNGRFNKVSLEKNRLNCLTIVK
jgi:hypothetical protein